MGNRVNKGLESLKEVLGCLNEAQGLPFDLRDSEIWQVWPSVVGDVVASNARPIEIRHRCLTVGVKEPIWLQELKYQGEDIRRRLNERLGREAIRTIRFRLLGRGLEY